MLTQQNDQVFCLFQYPLFLYAGRAELLSLNKTTRHNFSEISPSLITHGKQGSTMFRIIQANDTAHNRLDAFTQTCAVKFYRCVQIGQISDGKRRHFFCNSNFDQIGYANNRFRNRKFCMYTEMNKLHSKDDPFSNQGIV